MADAKKGAKGSEKKTPAAGVVEGAKKVVAAAKKAVAPVVDAAQNLAHAVAPGVVPAAHHEAPKAARGPGKRGARRTLDGVVRSDKMDKTVVVEVVSLKRDPVYGKYMRDRTRYKAHDEKNQFKTGDRVQIAEHRPLSRDKRWIVSKLIEAAKVE